MAEFVKALRTAELAVGVVEESATTDEGDASGAPCSTGASGATRARGAGSAGVAASHCTEDERENHSKTRDYTSKLGYIQKFSKHQKRGFLSAWDLHERGHNRHGTDHF